jgi:hypothetical protein
MYPVGFFVAQPVTICIVRSHCSFNSVSVTGNTVYIYLLTYLQIVPPVPVVNFDGEVAHANRGENLLDNCVPKRERKMGKTNL